MATFGSLVRRVGWFGWRSSPNREAIKPEERAQSLLPLIQSTFGQGHVSLVDLAPLEALLKDEQSYDSLAELIALFGARGIAFDPARLAEWYQLALPPSTLFGVFELTQPSTPNELDALFQVLEGQSAPIRIEALRRVASVYQSLKRSLSIDNLDLAIKALGKVELGSQGASFVACAEAYAAIGPIDPRFDRLLLGRVQDEEALAATAAMIDLVAAHLDRVRAYDDLRDLLEEVSDRITVRRLSKVLALCDENGVESPGLDSFQLRFATSQGELEWLERALKGLKELGRPIDRVVLMQVREWAPDTSTLGRYLSAVRAFQGLGLGENDIDRLVLKRVESEEKIQLLGLLGDLFVRLGLASLTLEQTEHLADILTDRSHVRRYEAAVGLLRELKLAPSDVGLLAEHFFEQPDDIYWLEALLASASEAEERFGRPAILHLRERCPDPSQLYRYFRLRRAFSWFPTDRAHLDRYLLDVAPAMERTTNLTALAEILQAYPSGITLPELQELEATYSRPEWIEAFGVCVRTFNGDWRRFAALLDQLRGSDDREAALAVVYRTFGARVSGNQFDRSLELLLDQLDRAPVTTPSA